jgi:hypothetical protein
MGTGAIKCKPRDMSLSFGNFRHPLCPCVWPNLVLSVTGGDTPDTPGASMQAV